MTPRQAGNFSRARSQEAGFCSYSAILLQVSKLHCFSLDGPAQLAQRNFSHVQQS